MMCPGKHSVDYLRVEDILDTREYSRVLNSGSILSPNPCQHSYDDVKKTFKI